MKFFIADKTNKNNSEVRCKETSCYTELEIPRDSDSSIYIYVIPRTENTYFVGICLNDIFDDFIENYDDELGNVYNEAWPQLLFLLNNGVKDKYANGALIRLEDADCGENKWFVATVIGNLSIDDADNKVSTAIELVIEKTQALLTELNENKPNTVKVFLEGVTEGIIEGLDILLSNFLINTMR